MGTLKERGGRLGSLALVAGLMLTTAGMGASSAAAAPSSLETARTKMFGAGWNNPGEVRARWIGNTTWAISYGGTFALHDTTIEDDFSDGGDKYANNGFVSLSDVITGKPDVIFQDHTHFDQNRDVAEISAKTGAPLVTTLQGCGVTKFEAIKRGFDANNINCNLLRDANGQVFNDFDTYFTAFYGGQGIVFTDYGTQGTPERAVPGLDVQAVLIKHTGTFISRPYPENTSGPNFDPAGSMQEILSDGGPPPEGALKTFASFDQEGGNVFYRVKYKDFTLVRHGSTGPTNPLEPGAEKIQSVLRSLGVDSADRPDLHIGGITEVENILNGQYHEDIKQHAGSLGAKLFFPTHHNNWFPYWLTMPAASYWPGMKETWADGAKEFDQFPSMCYLTEENFGSLWQFKMSEWKGDKVGKARPLTGPNCYTG